jgi:hypothetical protein
VTWSVSPRRTGPSGGARASAGGCAAAAGAAVIEAYPSPDGRAYRYMGTRELYRAAGFEEVPVPPNSRPVMRKPVEAGTVEAGTVEAGTVEAGRVEAGRVEAGRVEAGIRV